MSRRQEKRAVQERQRPSLELRQIKPMTTNQGCVFDAWWAGKQLMLHGTTGTGKSFIALYLALQSVIQDQAYDKVIVVRSVVPTRDMGFLPGNTKEKMRAYEDPYYAITAELFGRGDAYDVLKQKNLIEFKSTSFSRGMTMPNCVVVVDEVQNLTKHEADTIITRLGKNSRLIFCGDVRQIDLNKGREFTGLYDFMHIVKRMKSFDVIEFQTEDIVRSALVREYIMTRNKLEDEGVIESIARM